MLEEIQEKGRWNWRFVRASNAVWVGRDLTYPQDFLLLLIEHMGRKTPMSPEPLSSHHVPHA